MSENIVTQLHTIEITRRLESDDNEGQWQFFQIDHAPKQRSDKTIKVICPLIRRQGETFQVAQTFLERTNISLECRHSFDKGWYSPLWLDNLLYVRFLAPQSSLLTRMENVHRTDTHIRQTTWYRRSNRSAEQTDSSAERIRPNKPVNRNQNKNEASLSVDMIWVSKRIALNCIPATNPLGAWRSSRWTDWWFVDRGGCEEHCHLEERIDMKKRQRVWMGRIDSFFWRGQSTSVVLPWKRSKASTWSMSINDNEYSAGYSLAWNTDSIENWSTIRWLIWWWMRGKTVRQSVANARSSRE